MTEKISTLINELKTLTLLEAAELVKEIEETFDVDTSSNAGVMMVSGGIGATSEETAISEEKTEFDVSLEVVPADKKIAILKVVRSLTGLGLKEAKDVVENTPKILKEALTKVDAEAAKKTLEDAGATVILK